jgi:hypothetical protein
MKYFVLAFIFSIPLFAANAPSCGQVTKSVENVLSSVSNSNSSPSAPGSSTIPVGRYGDMPSADRTAYIEQARRMPQSEAYSYSGYPRVARAEILKDKPDWDKARNTTKASLSSGFDKFHRAATSTEKISFLKRIEDDAGLLGIQSRNSPIMMKKAKDIYTHALKERMKRESIKDPKGAIEWLQKLLAEKKSSSRVGVDGEIDRWSAEVIEEALQASQSNPKEWILDQFKNYKGFSKIAFQIRRDFSDQVTT